MKRTKLIEKVTRFADRGLCEPRDIHKKVLELPIPQFDAENPHHRQLAELGQACTAKVRQWIDNGGPGSIRSIGKLRGMVREMLREKLKEIDGIVEGMMSIHEIHIKKTINQ